MTTDTSAVNAASAHSPNLRADRNWRPLLTVLSAAFITLLDTTIVNLALPSIEKSLAATPGQLQWIVAGYSLAFGLVLVPAGRLGDLLGRRRLLIAGLVIFLLAALGCGFSPNASVLAGFRMLQGAAVAVINPQVVGLIQELFRGPLRGKAFGMQGMVIGISATLGPLLGGAMIGFFGPAQGWRSVFFVAVPLCLVALPAAWKYLPAAGQSPHTTSTASTVLAASTASTLAGPSQPGATPPDAEQPGLPVQPTPTAVGQIKLAPPEAPGLLAQLDLPGLFLLGAAVLSAMWPFMMANKTKGSAGIQWWMLGICALLLVAFFWWEARLDKRGAHPVIPQSLLRNTSFTLGTATATVYYAGFVGILIVLTLYLQRGVGLTPLAAAGVQVPFALSVAFSSAKSGKWVIKHGRHLVIAALSTMWLGVAGVALTALYAPQAYAPWIMLACLAVGGLGHGSFISPNQTLTLAAVPVAGSSTAGGVLQTAQRIGAAVSLTVLTMLFFGTAQKLLAAQGPGSSATQVAASFGHGLSTALAFSLALIGAAVLVAVIDLRKNGKLTVKA